ncbi:acyltransferase [Olleya marilimosa]|uniref:Acyltransferase n=1 Tax=Olleya marilimosa TaxID=272164 RepID=A0ABR8LVD5_9FLAO|nr:acyltransferase [Olleya marilimosa]MBD3864141.1 acyltransferase [Olleya marilimosa]
MKTYINFINSLIFKILPETRFYGTKRFLLRAAGISIGVNSRVCSSVRFLGNGDVEIGDNVWIGPQTLISSSKPATIKIKSHVGIGPQVYIATGTHKIDYTGVSSLGAGINLDIVIDEGAWISAKSVLIPGVRVNRRAIVAAGAVVNKDVPENTMVGGVPAKVIKILKDNV